jgi:transposase
MKHIGMDVHSTTTYACVRDDRNRVLLSCNLPTRAAELEKLVKSIQGPKRVMLEEDQMADWVTRVLQPHVDEVIRCQPRHNKLISEAEDKCDRMDAAKLSELLQKGYFKRVHHPEMKYRNLREGVRAYWIASRELTRAKNRIKAWYLFNGHHQVGPTVYSVRGRKKLMERMKRKGCNTVLAELLYDQMDGCRISKAKHIRMLRQTARPVRKLVRIVQTIPGIGPISAYTLVSLLEDGQRIRNKRSLWRYAGLSVRRHESREIGFEGASREGNRLLKRVIMGAATTIISRGESNGLFDFYQRDVSRKVDPKRARRNLARKIVVIAHHLLRSGRTYNNELIHP